MEVILGNSEEIILKSQAIRHDVFVMEQGIPIELDLDGIDESSIHALATDNGSLVATTRLYSSDGKHSIMARVAVTKEYRRNGVATKVIDAIISHAKNIGLSTVEIHAHDYLKEYYEKFGFCFIKNVEIVAGHQLIEMKLKL